MKSPTAPTILLILIAVLCWLIPQGLSQFRATSKAMEENLGKPQDIETCPVREGSVESVKSETVETDTDRVASSVLATITAYTSSPEETDNTPCENAWGWNICNLHKAGLRMVACPLEYEPSSLIEIDGIIYACMDRMNQEKHPDRFDIYFGQGEEAKQKAMEWGIKTLPIKIITNYE